MITLMTGTPGSGKSLDAARIISRKLKRGIDVIANFEVVCDEGWEGNFTYLPNNRISPGNIIDCVADYWDGKQPSEKRACLVVIDEAQLLFNSRDWQAKPADGRPSRMEWLEFMSQHRKYFCDVMLITQADIMIDRQFRMLVEYERNHRKVGNIGGFGKLMRVLAFGELFYVCETYYLQKVKVDGYFFRYKRKYGDMYDSYKAFDSGAVPQGAA